MAGTILSALIIMAASTVGLTGAGGTTVRSVGRIKFANSGNSVPYERRHHSAVVTSGDAHLKTKSTKEKALAKTHKHRNLPVATIAASAPVPSTADQGTGYVESNGASLMLNGQPYRFVGINIYMAASGGTPESCGGELYPNASVPLSDMPNGVVIRFWAFQNFFVSDRSFNWTNFDQFLAIAAAHDDKVIPVLANQYSYCDGVGKDLAWYQTGYESTVEPGDLVPYQKYVSIVVSRYANNPTIAMWQLVNEGEAVNSDGSCNEPAALSALIAFSNNIGGLIHNLDPRSLVSLGTLAGFSGSGAQWCGAANGDYQTLMASPGNDVCDFHDYGYPNSPMGMPFGPDLATAIAMCHADDKPIIVGETGILAEVGELNSRAEEFSAKFSAQMAAGVDGELLWEWNNVPNEALPGQGTTDSDYGIFPGDPSLNVLTTFNNS